MLTILYMDPRTNPYAPGAGTIPPELAGRDEIIEKVAIALDRCRSGLASRGLFLVGLRGVGKTVLLTRISQEAEAKGFIDLGILPIYSKKKFNLLHPLGLHWLAKEWFTAHRTAIIVLPCHYLMITWSESCRNLTTWLVLRKSKLEKLEIVPRVRKQFLHFSQVTCFNDAV